MKLDEEAILQKGTRRNGLLMRYISLGFPGSSISNDASKSEEGEVSHLISGFCVIDEGPFVGPQI